MLCRSSGLTHTGRTANLATVVLGATFKLGGVCIPPSGDQFEHRGIMDTTISGHGKTPVSILTVTMRVVNHLKHAGKLIDGTFRRSEEWIPEIDLCLT